jgi:hypothetical protein
VTDPEVKARLDEYTVCYSIPPKEWRPQPVKFCLSEGGPFVDWADRLLLKEARGAPGLQLHCVYFDDGSVFDAVNGWRKPRTP